MTMAPLTPTLTLQGRGMRFFAPLRMTEAGRGFSSDTGLDA